MPWARPICHMTSWLNPPSCWALQTNWRLLLHTRYHMLGPPNRLETVTAYSLPHVKSYSFSRWISVVMSWRFSGLDMKLECSNIKPVTSCKELGTRKTLQFWKILHRLLSRICSISFATPPVLLYKSQWCSISLWYQDPAILNLLDFARFRRKELLSFLVTELGGQHIVCSQLSQC